MTAEEMIREYKSSQTVRAPILKHIDNNQNSFGSHVALVGITFLLGVILGLCVKK